MFECAICGGNVSREILFINKPDRFERSVGISPKGYRRSWVECMQCGAATNLLPSASEEKLIALRSAYYEVDFSDSDIGEKYRRVMALPARKSDNAGRVSRIIEFACKWFDPGYVPQVLDIGAGTGVFLSRLIDETGGCWSYLGLEPDPQAAKHLRQLRKFPVIEAMYRPQLELADFSLITLNKVWSTLPILSVFCRK